MNNTVVNNRVKLPWPVLAWGVAMLVAVLAAWADMRVKMEAHGASLENMRMELAIRVQKATEDHKKIDERLDRLERQP